MKKIYTAALAVLAFAACTEDAKIKIDSLSIIPQTATVYTDEALPELALNVTPEDALGGELLTGPQVHLKSSALTRMVS